MRKSAKKIVAGFLAALMVLTMLPFTAFATEYQYGDVMDPSDYVEPGSINPKLDIVWTAWNGAGKSFILNGDEAWQEAANNSGTPMDLSAVSVEGLTPDQFPESAQGANGVGYVCATIILKDCGNQFGHIELKFGWDDTVLTCGTFVRGKFSPAKSSYQDPDVAECKYNYTDGGAVFNNMSSTTDDNDNMFEDLDGQHWTHTAYLCNSVQAGQHAVWVDDNFTFETVGPNNGDEYSGVTIEGVYIGTIGFEIKAGETVNDHLIKWTKDTDMARFCTVAADETTGYAIAEGDFVSGVTPAGRLEVIYSDEQEPAEKEYTVTYKDANGSEISTEKVKEGNAPAQVPELPANDYDTENHYTYSWDGDTTAPITGDTTFQVVKSGTPHSYTSEVIQDATYDLPEITKYTCSVCGGTYTKETASALKGYDVTVKGSDMGTVTLNDVAVDGDSLTKKIAANGAVKLVATASDTCEFVGWQVGNKIVSTDATYETIVNAPITYTPVFVDKSEALEFVFLDMFGNVISSQRVSNASEVVIPDAPVYNGYKFTGWTANADTIHQSQESMTITALFEKDTDANFTVNAEGATISYGDVSAENTLADVPYGTQVTVTKEGATGWQINGADVAYGDSYTFYVASDVTVAPIDTAVTAKPVVAAVSYSQLSNSHKVEFVASRAMTDDCTLIKAGWVYGKNLTDADLTLDKVGQVGTGTDSGVVKAAYVSSTEGNTQFILSYGITAQTGTASAKAFITYRDAEGEIQTVYSDAMDYTYGA